MHTNKIVRQIRGWVTLLMAAAAILSAGCDSLFYFPDRVEYEQPLLAGQTAEAVYFAAQDGVILHGRFIPATAQPALGTVIHFHGNAQNLTSHYWFVNWLPAAGYNVFQFDYRGYGRSGLWRLRENGQNRANAPGGGLNVFPPGDYLACDLPPDRDGVFRDCVAALNYVKARPDVAAVKILGFGQSLGGCAMLGAVVESEPNLLCGVVVESTFRSYREMGRRKAGQSWLLWPFQYPLSWLFVSDAHSPADYLDRLSDLPLLAIYGLADEVVPGDQTQLLYDQWSGPKQLAMVPNSGHLQARERVGDRAYIHLVDTFFHDCLQRRAQTVSGAAKEGSGTGVTDGRDDGAGGAPPERATDSAGQ